MVWYGPGSGWDEGCKEHREVTTPSKLGEAGKSRGHPVHLLAPGQDELYLRHS